MPKRRPAIVTKKCVDCGTLIHIGGRKRCKPCSDDHLVQVKREKSKQRYAKKKVAS
jgi:hypothetical protein